PCRGRSTSPVPACRTWRSGPSQPRSSCLAPPPPTLSAQPSPTAGSFHGDPYRVRKNSRSGPRSVSLSRSGRADETGRVMALPDGLLRSLAGSVGEPHVLTGAATAGFAVDWTGRFRGQTPAVVRPRDTAEAAAVLALCTDAGLPVVPQGGNTGLVGGGVPLHGEVVLSLTRLNRLGPVDQE